MSYKINLEQLTTSQLRAVFFNLRLARFDNLKNSQILTEIDVALDQINLAFRAFESKIFMPIEAFIPAEAVSASKISCSLSMSSGFLEVIANFAVLIHPVSIGAKDLAAAYDNVGVRTSETTTNSSLQSADVLVPAATLPLEVTVVECTNDVLNGHVELPANPFHTSICQPKVAVEENAESQTGTFGSRDQKSRDYGFVESDSHLVNADEFMSAVESANSSLCPIYFIYVSICSSTGGGGLLVQPCFGVAEPNLRPSRKPPWILFRIRRCLYFHLLFLFGAISRLLSAVVYPDLWTSIISYAACFMPIDPLHFVLGQNRSLKVSLSDKPRCLSLPRSHLLRLTDGHVIAILAFVSCVLYALVLSLLNLGPKQVYQQSFTQLLAFYSLLISSTITAKTHQAVYGQMRFILPRIAIKLRVNCLNISINISFCILQ